MANRLAVVMHINANLQSFKSHSIYVFFKLHTNYLAFTFRSKYNRDREILHVAPAAVAPVLPFLWIVKWSLICRLVPHRNAIPLFKWFALSVHIVCRIAF